MGTPLPPEAGLDALLKLISFPSVGYFLLFLVQRRKILLSLLQAAMRTLSQHAEDKRASQAVAAANGNGHRAELVIMNLDQLIARIGNVEKDTERGLEELNARIAQERRERMEQGLDIRAEFDKVIHRTETYRKYTDDEIGRMRGYVDARFSDIQTEVRRGFEGMTQAIRDLKPEARS